MKELYKDTNFRHKYSEIYRIISRYDSGAIELENIEHNFTELNDYIDSLKKDEQSPEIIRIIKQISKLYDHTAIEIGRARELYRKFSFYDEDLKTKIEQQRKEYDNLKNATASLGDTLKENKKDTKTLQLAIRNSQSNIITIVSLLVSIVPLLATNISYIAQDLSLLAILMCNGTMILVIGIVFSLISFIVVPQHKMLIPSVIALAVGILMIWFSISNSEIQISNPIKSIIEEQSQSN